MLRRIIIPAVVLLFPFSLVGQATVSRVSVVARPRTFTGRCPANLNFRATIQVRRSALVEYQWERSDGAKGARRRIRITGGWEAVTDAWRLGRGHERMVVWERVRILAPTGMLSPAARVSINCR